MNAHELIDTEVRPGSKLNGTDDPKSLPLLELENSWGRRRTASARPRRRNG